MDYVTQYYKNLSEQLQQRVNILTRKVKYLTEAEATPGPTDGGKTDGGKTDGGNGYQLPYYSYPSQSNPYPRPRPPHLKPGQYDIPPGGPPTDLEWMEQNPPPNPDSPNYAQELYEWTRKRKENQDQRYRWYRQQGIQPPPGFPWSG